MNSYEFAYFGRDLRTRLLEGAWLRISGPENTVREAMRMVRVWMRRSS